jgi:hypothetical protein
MESAFDPKPNANAPTASKIALLSMCSSPSDEDDHHVAMADWRLG